MSNARFFGLLLLTLAWATPAGRRSCEAQLQRTSLAQESEKSVRVARELLSNVVTTQLRQLEDNQLQNSELYADLAQLQQRLSQLSQERFLAVGALIQAAENAPSRKRGRAWNAAREEVRQIVLQLVIERRKVLGRMQLAHWADDARQLLELQAAAQILAQQTVADEAKLLEAIQSQKFVGQLYRQFDTALGEAIAWGEQSSRVAEVARRLLRAAETDQHLQAAEQSLLGGDRQSAVVEQGTVLRTLRTLLPMLRPAADKAEPSLALALQLVDDIRRRQQSLNEQAANNSAKETMLSQLVARQQHVHEQLGRLLEQVRFWPEMAAMTEVARASAFRAVDKLFQKDRSVAFEHAKLQSQLDQLRQALEREFHRQSSDRSADELAQEVETLTRTVAQLKKAVATQREVGQSLQADLSAARKRQAAVGELAERLPKDHRYAAARQRIENASGALQAAPSTDDAAAQQAVRSAIEALEQVLSETTAELADLRRRHKAIEVGELARAAEALERVSAAEGRLAKQLAAGDKAAHRGAAQDQKQKASLEANHQKAQETVKRIAAGIRNTAPKAAEALQKLLPEFERAANEQGRDSPRAKPLAAAEKMQPLRKALAQAAAQVRHAGADSAEELSQLANRQLAALTQTRNQMQQLANAAPRAAQQAATLADEALAAMRTARQAGLEAAGNVRAAQLSQRIEQLDNAQQQNDYVAAMAERLSKGRGDSSWLVANEQQKITEATKEIAQNAEEALQRTLNAAADASAEAARADLKNNAAAGEEARRKVKALLTEARRKAEALRDEALAVAQNPTGAAGARRAAAESLEEARQKAARVNGSLAKQTEESLEKAGEMSQQAAAQAAAGEEENAQKIQQKINPILAHVAEQLEQAQAEASKALAQALRKQAQAAKEMAQQAADVDPQAAQALRHIEASDAAAESFASNRLLTQAAAQRVATSVARALESVSAREQQVRRDATIAQRMAELMRGQQKTRDEIAKQAAILEQPESNTNEETQTQQRRRAGEAINNAMREFAETQVETGEGAVAISGQEDVANQDLLAGLRAASQLADGMNAEPDDATNGEAAGEASADGETPLSEDAADKKSSQNEGPNQPKEPMTDKPGEMRPPSEGADPSDAKAAQADGELGGKFVPRSPEETARQIAGAQAAQAASAMKGQAGENAAPSQSGEQAEGDNIRSLTSGKQQRTERASGDASTGRELQDDPPDDFTGVSARDAEQNTGMLLGRKKRFAEPAWFAKLPPSLRDAIRAKSRLAPPRSYELRLKRYFQSNE